MKNNTKKLVCPECGGDWIEGDIFCRYCGAKKDKPKKVEPVIACIYGPQPVLRTHKCDDCGYEWSTSLMIDKENYCPKCGGKTTVSSSAPNYEFPVFINTENLNNNSNNTDC